MKKTKKIFALVLSFIMVLSILPVIPFTAIAESEGIFQYSVTNGNATITGINSELYDAELNIPSTIAGWPVTTIGYRAFENRTGLTSVNLPDSLIILGDGAFYGCTGLTDITIPGGVTLIGVSTFEGCNAIETIEIPDSTTSINTKAFYNCTKLASVKMGNSVYSIGYGAFEGCVALKELIIPDSVDSIGGNVCHNCTELSSVTIGNTLRIIGDCAFEGCVALNSVTLSDSITYVGDNAFNDTPWYSNQPDGCIYIGKVLYEYRGACPSSVKIKKGTVCIADYAFYNCKELESVTIPDGLESIYGFNGCSGLTSVTIPDSVNTIGGRAFSGCSGLKSIIIPASVYSISPEAFAGCTGLRDVYFAGRSRFNLSNLSVPRKHYASFIYYKLSGGTNADGNPGYYFDDSATIIFKNPSKKGYEFAGWYDGSNKVEKIEKGSYGSVTLTAKWTPVNYTITYKLNGGKNNSKNPKTYTVTSTVNFKNPARKGYKFAGWYTNAKFTGKKVTKISKGTAKKVTLYAKWTKETYKITYKLNKGKNNAKNPKTYTVTTSAIKLKNPTRKGYFFKGWYSDAKFNKRVTKIAKGSTGNKTLYAKWAKAKKK